MEVVFMKSRAVDGVDGWLEQAEGVLRAQYERYLSPSSPTIWDAGEGRTDSHPGRVR